MRLVIKDSGVVLNIVEVKTLMFKTENKTF